MSCKQIPVPVSIDVARILSWGSARPVCSRNQREITEIYT